MSKRRTSKSISNLIGRDPLCDHLSHIMDIIWSEYQNMPLPDIQPNIKSEGLASSKLGSEQVKKVAMTPLMLNAIKHYDKPSDDFQLKVDSPETKAESAFRSNIEQLLLRFNGDGKSGKYNELLPLTSKNHYDVQCYQNFKDNMRDIQPGQADERLKMIDIYRHKTYLDVKKVQHMMNRDPLFRKCINLIIQTIPDVKASHDIKEINLPFMSKHSGVGYPYYRKDTTVDPSTGKTYAEETLDLAKQLQYKFDQWYKYNVSTAYGRNQRGKGRLLIAVSRVLNLLINPLESQEIDAYKAKSPMFVGYRDDQDLKKALIQIVNDCNKYGFKCANEDYSRFDSTVGAGLIVLVGAISTYKAQGEYSKKIAIKRSVFALRTMLVSGLSNDVFEIFGRVFSGYIDTNRGGGLVNSLIMTYLLGLEDPKYTEVFNLCSYPMLVMGDDNLHIYRVKDREHVASNGKKVFGVNLSPQKFEYGPIFLQYRLFEDPHTKELIMVYPWTRVLRSMLFKEESKGLGPAGWVAAWYQQLFKLIEFKEAFSIVVNLIMPFDESKLYIDKGVQALLSDIKAEDDKAYAELKTDSQRRRFMTTLSKLDDGDPSKQRFNNQDVHSSDSLFSIVLAKIKDVYDPNFYQKYNLRF